MAGYDVGAWLRTMSCYTRRRLTALIHDGVYRDAFGVMLSRFGCARLIAFLSATAMTRVLYPALRSPRTSPRGRARRGVCHHRRIAGYKTQQSAMTHCPVNRSGSLARNSRTTRQGWFGETSTPSSRASSIWARKSSLAPHALTGLL